MGQIFSGSKKIVGAIKQEIFELKLDLLRQTNPAAHKELSNPTGKQKTLLSMIQYHCPRPFFEHLCNSTSVAQEHLVAVLPYADLNEKRRLAALRSVFSTWFPVSTSEVTGGGWVIVDSSSLSDTTPSSDSSDIKFYREPMSPPGPGYMDANGVWVVPVGDTATLPISSAPPAAEGEYVPSAPLLADVLSDLRGGAISQPSGDIKCAVVEVVTGKSGEGEITPDALPVDAQAAPVPDVLSEEQCMVELAPFLRLFREIVGEEACLLTREGVSMGSSVRIAEALIKKLPPAAVEPERNGDSDPVFAPMPDGGESDALSEVKDGGRNPVPVPA